MTKQKSEKKQTKQAVMQEIPSEIEIKSLKKKRDPEKLNLNIRPWVQTSNKKSQDTKVVSSNKACKKSIQAILYMHECQRKNERWNESMDSQIVKTK